MIRKYVFALSALSLPLGAVAFGASSATAAVAPHKTVTFTGSIKCNVESGKITATPPITSSAQTVTITLKGTAFGCTGSTSEGGATITTGKILATTGAVSGVSCDSLLSGIPKATGAITWATTGNKATKSSFSTTTSTLGQNSAGTETSLTFGTTDTGSFAGTGSAAGWVKKSESALATECLSTGISSLTLVKGPGTSADPGSTISSGAAAS